MAEDQYSIEVKTAADLIEQLRIEEWTEPGQWTSEWVFRGQLDDPSWRLTPKSWRPNETIVNQLRAKFVREKRNHYERDMYIPAGYARDRVLTVDSLAAVEFEMVKRFVDVSNQLGFKVPDADKYDPPVSVGPLSPMRNYHYDMPFHAPYGAIALAQHHGVPTNLLDWSRNPLCAAYFACNEVQPTTPAAIAVWAIRPSALTAFSNNLHNLYPQQPELIDELTTQAFRVLELGRADNAFLHAQDGLFLHAPEGLLHYARTGNLPDLIDYALTAQAQLQKPVLRKLTLPGTEVQELTRLLWLRGISIAHLMPGFDSVAGTLRRTWAWEGSQSSQ